MILKHLQDCGHKPIILVGGATGMVGDPSGKSKERNLLDEATLERNLSSIRKQLEKFLNFDCGSNSAEIVNNFDWFKNYSFLEFIRDVGKHISINYMMSKDSVKSRLETGMSFTEFSYQLVQGYDFYRLWKDKNCIVQLGGSDINDLVECSKKCEQYGYDEINLNVGCPSNRVQKGSFGACLMLKPELVKDCLGTVSYTHQTLPTKA